MGLLAFAMFASTMLYPGFILYLSQVCAGLIMLPLGSGKSLWINDFYRMGKDRGSGGGPLNFQFFHSGLKGRSLHAQDFSGSPRSHDAPGGLLEDGQDVPALQPLTIKMICSRLAVRGLGIRGTPCFISFPGGMDQRVAIQSPV
jgi:hypothetical protein